MNSQPKKGSKTANTRYPSCWHNFFCSQKHTWSRFKSTYSCYHLTKTLVVFLLALYRNLLLLNFNDEPATKSIVRLSAPEAESIVDYFIATMYGGQEVYGMNGNMIESSMIPGSTSMSPSPTMAQQQHQGDLYSNGNANMIASLRTHSSKFPVSFQTNFRFRRSSKIFHSAEVFLNQSTTVWKRFS